ncbi:MAG TPA: discoidin domain-containing protein, partial [Umezawaea sp.]|nr:discoidin domain-containing protein [Umezawaea sp.]
FPYLTAGPPGSGSQSRWPGMSYGGNTDFSEAWGPKGGPNWADYRFVNDALARVQLTMRQGVARFDCAVFRHDFGMNGAWTTGVGGDTLLRSTSELAAAGYTYEYLAPAHIMREDAAVSGRVLFRDNGGYRALIVRKQSTMSVEAAKALLRFAREGLPVLVVGDPPSQVPGFDPAGVLDKQLAEVISRLVAQPTTRMVKEDEDLPSALRAFSVEPAAAPVGGTGPLLSLRRHTPSVDYYLLINPTGVPVRQVMRLAGRGTPYLMDAWTGGITPVPDGRPDNDAAVVAVELGAGDITVIAVTARHDHTFSRAARPVASPLAATPGGGTPVPLRLGSWTLAVESWTPGPSGQPGDTARTPLGVVRVVSGEDGTLPAWTAITGEKGYPEDLADVSGIGTYTADITLGDVWNGVKSAYLDVGTVVDTVRVAVNGRDLPPVNQLDRRHIEVGPYLRPGRNTVSIRVASTLLNAVRVAPGADASGRPRMDYGLIGPVTLTPRASRNPILTAEALQKLVPLAAGGYNEVAVTVTNGSPRPHTVKITASAADGITAVPEPARVTLAGGESTAVTVKVRNAGLDSGTSPLTVTAGVDNGPAATTTSTLAHSRNLAQNPYGTVLPRLYGSASQDFYPPLRAVDGKVDTFWVSRGRATGQGPTKERPVDFTVDFGDEVQIGTVGVSSGPQADYGPQDFDIDTSDDGRNWTTVRSVVHAPRGTSTTTFPPVQARYLRLRITATLDPLRRNVQIAELVATP